MSAYTPRNIEEAIRLAEMIARSGMKFGARTPEDILMVIMAGAEVGLQPLSALQNIHVMQGRPVMSARVVVARALAHPECESFRLVEETQERVTYEAKRRGGDPVRRSYSLEQAQRAGLLNNPTWKRHPGAMMRARASSSLARDLFADAAIGLAIADDLADDMEPVTTAPQAPDVEHEEGWRDACAKGALAIVRTVEGASHADAKRRLWDEIQARSKGGRITVELIGSCLQDIVDQMASEMAEES